MGSLEGGDPPPDTEGGVGFPDIKTRASMKHAWQFSGNSLLTRGAMIEQKQKSKSTQISANEHKQAQLHVKSFKSF